MKPRLCLGITLFVVCTICACGWIGQKPEAVVSKYIDAHLHGDYKLAYQYISAEDKAVKSLDEYISEQDDGGPPLLEIFESSISYKIDRVTTKGDKAKADVTITVPDPSAIFGDLLGAAFSSVLAGDDAEEELARILEEKYKGKRLPTTTFTESLELVKEADGWRVYFDWKTQERVAELRESAEKLENSKQYSAARDKYVEIIWLSGDSPELSSKISELEKEAEEWEAKRAYLDQVEVRSIKVSKTVFGDPGVWGEIKNLGKRTLTEVEITVYCLDSEGAAIYEESYHPVLNPESSLLAMLGNTEPLKPNYSAKFGYSLEDAPSDWAGKVRVQVTDVEF